MAAPAGVPPSLPPLLPSLPLVAIRTCTTKQGMNSSASCHPSSLCGVRSSLPLLISTMVRRLVSNSNTPFQKQDGNSAILHTLTCLWFSLISIMTLHSLFVLKSTISHTKKNQRHYFHFLIQTRFRSITTSIMLVAWYILILDLKADDLLEHGYTLSVI